MNPSRRYVLKGLGGTLAVLAAEGSAAAFSLSSRYPPPIDRPEFQRACVGPRNLAINIHNCGPGCAEQQLPYLERIGRGLLGVRIGPYFVPGKDGLLTPAVEDPFLERTLDLYGNGVILLLNDGDDTRRPSRDRILANLEQLLEQHPRITQVELMNEPKKFDLLSPREYVSEFALPVRKWLDERNAKRRASSLPPVMLWSAGWYGTKDGVKLTKEMLAAEREAARGYDRPALHGFPHDPESIFDGVAVHIYDTKHPKRAIDRLKDYLSLPGLGPRPVTVSETGVPRYDEHLRWIERIMTRMELLLDKHARQALGSAHSIGSPFVRAQQLILYTFKEDPKYNLLDLDLKKGWTSRAGKALERRKDACWWLVH